MSGGGKRPGAGRPKHSHKLPDSYFWDLRYLFDLWRHGKPPYWTSLDSAHPGRGVSKACFNIVQQGGVKWIDRATGVVVAKIGNVGSLRNRLLEACKPITITWTYTSTHRCESPADPGPLVVDESPIVVTARSEATPRATYLVVGRAKLYK